MDCVRQYVFHVCALKKNSVRSEVRGEGPQHRLKMIDSYTNRMLSPFITVHLCRSTTSQNIFFQQDAVLWIQIHTLNLNVDSRL